jgi:hypothetical protein
MGGERVEMDDAYTVASARTANAAGAVPARPVCGGGGDDRRRPAGADQVQPGRRLPAPLDQTLSGLSSAPHRHSLQRRSQGFPRHREMPPYPDCA